MERLSQAKSLLGAVFKLKITGQITNESTEKLKKQLNQIKMHSPVALAVVINSMGGSASQSNLMREELLSYVNRKKIKLYCFAEEYAGSGGYLILSAGNEVYSARSSLIGCIGARFNFFDVSELASSYGIKRRKWSTSEKDLDLRLDPLSPLSAEAQNWMKEILGSSTVQLQKLISEKRGKISQNAFTGELFNSKEASDMGLVDGLGTCDQTMAKLYPQNKIMDLGKNFLGLDKF